MTTKNDKPMFAEERKMAIVETVIKSGSITVVELCDLFDVSPATIRNDLRDLEMAGKLLRTHGGAMVRQRTGSETTLAVRAIENVEAKKKIALAAIECIEDGDTLILDVGTTIYELAKLVVERRKTTIVTNDLNIGLLADDHPETEIYLLGGRTRPGYHCTLGPSAIDDLKDVAVDKAFLGTNGLDVDYGASTPDPNHGEVKKAMFSAASKRYLLCDASKIGKRSFSRFAEPKDIDVIVTDRISKNQQERFEESGIEVVCRTTVEDQPQDEVDLSAIGNSNQ